MIGHSLRKVQYKEKRQNFGRVENAADQITESKSLGSWDMARHDWLIVNMN